MEKGGSSPKSLLFPTQGRISPFVDGSNRATTNYFIPRPLWSTPVDRCVSPTRFANSVRENGNWRSAPTLGIILVTKYIAPASSRSV